jgi:Ca2+-binding EF-hand superfamily protein
MLASLAQDGDGLVTATEFRAVMSTFLDSEEVERLLKEKDVDGDGKISYAEFCGTGSSSS